jgi:hypothetical protein
MPQLPQFDYVGSINIAQINLVNERSLDSIETLSQGVQAHFTHRDPFECPLFRPETSRAKGTDTCSSIIKSLARAPIVAMRSSPMGLNRIQHAWIENSETSDVRAVAT